MSEIPKVVDWNETVIDAPEMSTVLAALTFWRQCRLSDAENRPPIIHNIATNGEQLPSLSDEQVQLLIERLNGAVRIRVC